MAYDGITMEAVCRELNEKLIGARVEKIFQPKQQEVLLSLRTRDHTFTILCSADARLSRVHLTQVRQENPPTPPPFCMLLRKHLGGAKLLHIRQEALERVLTLAFASHDDLGRETTKNLVCEIMGKHSNLILTVAEEEGEWRILGSARAVTEKMSRHRVVLPGEIYLPPPAQHKLSLFALDEEELAVALTGDVPPEQLVVRAVMGIGPEIARELLFLAAGPETLHPLEMVRSLTIKLRQLADTVTAGTYEPCIARSPDGHTSAFAPVLLSRFPAEWLTIYPTVNEMLDDYFVQTTRQLREEELKNRLSSLARAALSRTEKKRHLQEKDLHDAQDADRYRLYGEMLTAGFHLLKPGQKEAVVTNFYSPTQEPLLVPLDQARSPQENARRYFKKYRKLKDGAIVIKQRLEATSLEADYLESILIALAHSDLDSLLEIQEEMEQAGLLRASPLKKQRPQSSAPLRFISADSIEILVGKNNRQNDLLTQKTASPSDIWLHVKDYPGSHVVIRNADPPERTLLEAARLAVRYSKAAASGKVPVDYTQVKHVRKPKGARPGMVIYDHQSTLYVAAD